MPTEEAPAAATPVPATPAEESSEPTPTLPAYVSVDIPAAGLQVEVPAGWTRLEPDWVWAPEAESELRVGVKWEDLNPPQEPEAALLPEDAQIIETSEVDLSIGAGRRFLMSRYGPAVEGGDEQAPVESVHIHVLVTQTGDVRRGFDFYAIAPDENTLPEVKSVLEHLLETITQQAPNEDPIAMIHARVAEELDIQLDAVQIVMLEPTEWPDACLGLPAEGEMCATVITPGYHGTIQAESQTYTLRANQDGTRVVVIPGAVDPAREALAQDLEIDPEAITLVSFESVEWEDACLGIDKEGQVCAQVVTPGHRFIFRANGQRYEVRTDTTGEAAGIVTAE
jgi:hypothetical protein